MSARPPLPVWDIVVESWRQVAGNAAAWLPGALFPFLMLVALNRLDAWLDSPDFAGLPWRFAYVLLYALPMAWFLVPWYRQIMPSATLPAAGADYVRFALRLLGLDVAFFVATLPMRAAMIQLLALDDQPDPQLSGTFLIAALLVPPALYAYARCSLAIPAAAAGADDRYERAWRATEDNGWRIVGAALLVSAPVVLLTIFLPARDPEMPPSFAMSVIVSAVQIALELLVATVLARVHARLS